MKKIILILILFIPLKVYAVELPELNSKNFIIYDITSNEILNEHNSNEQTSLASLTKIMTVITAIEHINNLEEKLHLTNTNKIIENLNKIRNTEDWSQAKEFNPNEEW